MKFTPTIKTTFDIPTRAEDLSNRLHNKFVKDALRESLEEQYHKNFRSHFAPSAKTKYQHEKRSLSYLARKKKKKGHTIDMLYSGASRRLQKSTYKVTVGGTAAKGTIAARLTTRFAFFGGSGRVRKTKSSAGAVASEAGERLIRMVRERERWTDEEAKAAAAAFLTRYMAKVAEYRGKRKRVRLPKG